MSRRRSRGFSRRDALHGWTLHFGPNMTPMVDVVMVILVFFMASAAFVGSEWFLRAGVQQDTAAGPGQTSTQAAAPPDPLAQRLEILMDRAAGPDGPRTVVTAFELVQAPIDSLATRLRAMPKGDATSRLRMIVRPAANVPYQDVVRVHEAVYAAGIENVGLGKR